MPNQSEKNRKRKAIIATVVFHVIAVILFFIFGLTQPVPLPEDAGASIEFGWEEAAAGEAVADVQNTQPEQQQVQDNVPQEQVVEETPVEEVASQENSDVAVPDEEPTEQPQPEKPQEKPEPEKKPEPTVSNELNEALESLNTPSGGGSQGDSETGEGDQGNPQGTTGDGKLGSGSGSWELDGRSMLPGYGTKISDTKEEGVVVLNIWVNQQGKVIKVQPNLRESNTTSQYLINMAKNDVLNNFKYNGDPAAAIQQRGKVRYDFRLK